MLHEEDATDVLTHTVTGFDIPLNDKAPPGAAQPPAPSPVAAVTGGGCKDGADPFRGQLVDAYKPPEVAKESEKQQWESAVKALMSTVSRWVRKWLRRERERERESVCVCVCSVTR